MKHTILGFKQESVLKVHTTLIETDSKGEDKVKEISLDIIDLVLLKWVSDLCSRPGVVKKIIEGQTMVWVNYATLLEDLPILRFGKRSLMDRLQKMVTLGVLSHYHDTEKGSFSFYALTELSTALVYDTEKGCEEIFIGGVKKTSQQKLTNKKTYFSKTIQERRDDFVAGLYKECEGKYPKEMLDDFVGFWTEQDIKQPNVMRFEKCDCFSFGRRMATWNRNNKNGYGKPKPTPTAQPTQTDSRPRWMQLGYPSEEEYNEWKNKKY